MTGMSNHIAPATLSVATYIAANLRTSDVDEFRAVFGDRDVPQLLAGVALVSAPHAYAAFVNGDPVFVFGISVSPMMPQLGVAWGFGTDKAWKSIPMVGRFIRKVLVPTLLSEGIHRVEVRVLSSATSSLGWLSKRMGARFETVLCDCGVNRESFHQFAWTRGQFEHVPNAKNQHSNPNASGHAHGAAENRQ